MADNLKLTQGELEDLAIQKANIINDIIKNVVDEGIPVTNYISDGYHSFAELYIHRAFLFASICHMFPQDSWKSKFHDDGTMYPNMFIAGINTDKGPATYHYDMDMWGLFQVNEIVRAPKFDGHTSAIALDRIYNHIAKRKYLKSVFNVTI